MKRVLMVNYEYPPIGGGGGVVTRDIAETLAGELDITVLTSSEGDLQIEQVRDGLRIVRTPVWGRHARSHASMASMLSFFPSSLRTGRKLAAEKPFDLVHTYFAVPSGPSGLLLARRFGVPHIVSLMGGDVYDPSKKLSPHRTPLLGRTVRWVMRKSDSVVAVSDDIRRRAEQYYGIEGIDRIHNAWNAVPYEPATREELGLGADDKVLITVARIVERKGLRQLLDVMDGIDDPRVRLVIVGEGPKREELQAQAQRLGLGERVVFTGFVSEERKWQLLHAADMYVSTAEHEGFGIVFLEGMAEGLPVISYDCGGQTEFLNDDCGFLVASGDKDRFRERVLELARDDVLRRAKSQVARDVAQEFTKERLAERWLRHYERVLGRAPVEQQA